MQTTEIVLIIGLILQFLAFAAVMIGMFRRIATKADIKQLEDRFDAQDVKIENLRLEMKADFERVDDHFAQQGAKFEARFVQQDAKFEARFAQSDARLENYRLETKADIQRVEDRLERANEYHARSVDLLDAIRQQLTQRGEPL